MMGFLKNWGLPSIHGIINCMQIHIHKTHGYICCKLFFLQVENSKHVVASCCQWWKMCHDVFVGMSSSLNDSMVLWLPSFYEKATYNGLFNPKIGSQNKISLYKIGDKGYLMWPYLMIMNKESRFDIPFKCFLQ